MRQITKRKWFLYGGLFLCAGGLIFGNRWVRGPVSDTTEPLHLLRVGNPRAEAYVIALCTEKWDDVVDRTFWMQEHLKRVRIAEGLPRAVAAAREALKRQVSCRYVGANQLRPEGVEDQYVFAPGVRVTALGSDAGRTDLLPNILDRTWFHVEFPDESTALRDENGVAIRALDVGVTISPSGQVVKASVVGNLEIVRKSLVLDWSR